MSTTLGRALIGGTAAGVVAAVVNALIFAAGVVDPSVETPAGGPIPLGAVVAFSLLPNVVGGGVFWALLRRASSTQWTWRTVVAIVTVVSMVPILGLEGAPVSMRIALAAMHVVAGVAAATVTPAVAVRAAT